MIFEPSLYWFSSRAGTRKFGDKDKLLSGCLWLKGELADRDRASATDTRTILSQP